MFSDNYYRSYLSSTSPTEERDIDFCGPSNLLVTFFTKWQLVLAPVNLLTPNLTLAAGAPRRWYTAEGFAVTNAPSLYGNVSYTVAAASNTTVGFTGTLFR